MSTDMSADVGHGAVDIGHADKGQGQGLRGLHPKIAFVAW